MTGKEIRMQRITRDGKMLCVPLDHGVSIKQIGNLCHFTDVTRSIVSGGTTAIIVHKGMVQYLPALNHCGLIVHLSASTENFNEVNKSIVCEVQEAIKLGADAVSVHVNLGNQYEQKMLSDFARISRDCEMFGVPLMAMMYIRNDQNFEVSTPETIKHAVRIATELGADIVKIPWLWETKELEKIVCDSLIPIVPAGGSYNSDKEQFYSNTKMLMCSGVAGVSFGRNVFMNKNPENVIHRLSQIIFMDHLETKSRLGLA